MPNVSKKGACRFRTSGIEKLENRSMLAASISYNSTTDTVFIYGDDSHDDVLVSLSSGKVVVRVSSVPSTGYSLVPTVIKRTFSNPSDVDALRFYGYGGDDTFISNLKTVPVYANGGAGNDYLESYNGADTLYGGAGNDEIWGYGGNDTIYGGSGNDKIYGGSGNDHLYGQSGNDKIWGDAGHDGLYGGSGTDELRGGTGNDRFLVMSSQSEHKDLQSGDAVLRFKNGNKTWNESEIVAVDGGLKVLHMKTLNDNLLELKSGGVITFVRQKSSGTAFASNNSSGTISMYDKSFNSTDRTAATVVHEIGHNWDTEHANWKKWLAISGWTNKNPNNTSKYAKGTSKTESWWYLKSAAFVTSYAKTNPREDMAESWEAYFIKKKQIANVSGMNAISTKKYQHLDAFFASMA